MARAQGVLERKAGLGLEEQADTAQHAISLLKGRLRGPVTGLSRSSLLTHFFTQSEDQDVLGTALGTRTGQ